MTRSIASLFAATGAALLLSTGIAQADGYEVAAPAAAEEGRKFTYSFNLGITSDYVFRGVSQSDNDPALQGGVDVGWGIIYAGIWTSRIDFADAPPVTAEVDWYGGIKPVWQSPFGTINMDFGAIYYSYPGADPGFAGVPDPNYFELKAGYSWSALHPSLVTGTTLYWSPDYVFETGSVWTIETMAAWTVGKFGPLTPVINGVVGWQKGDANDGYFVNFNQTDDEYYYWNAGLNLAVDNISFDFRYWDTNINDDASGLICGNPGLCEERFVFSVKVVVP